MEFKVKLSSKYPMVFLKHRQEDIDSKTIGRGISRVQDAGKSPSFGDRAQRMHIKYGSTETLSIITGTRLQVEQDFSILEEYIEASIGHIEIFHDS